MRKVIVFLLAVALLVPTVALAGQDKVAVCHLDEEGNYIPINIADPALDAHLAHGDEVVGVNLDENCEPLLAQAGCMPYIAIGNYVAYSLITDGSKVQDISGHEYYSGHDCIHNPGGAFFGSGVHIVWAASFEEADAICSSSATDTATANMYICEIY